MQVLGFSSVVFMNLCIFYTEVIEIEWKYFVDKTEAERAN